MLWPLFFVGRFSFWCGVMDGRFELSRRGAGFDSHFQMTMRHCGSQHRGLRSINNKSFCSHPFYIRTKSNPQPKHAAPLSSWKTERERESSRTCGATNYGKKCGEGPVIGFVSIKNTSTIVFVRRTRQRSTDYKYSYAVVCWGLLYVHCFAVVDAEDQSGTSERNKEEREPVPCNVWHEKLKYPKLVMIR